MTNRLTATLALTGVLMTLAGCGMSINSSISVADGETHRGDLSTVNGRVKIGDDAKVVGTARSVNGGVSAGNNSTVKTMETVNGSVKLGESSLAEGDLKTVNGSVSIGNESKVTGKVSTINGSVNLYNATIEGNVSTVNGNVKLEGGSRIKGDVVYHGKSSDNRSVRKITLSDNSVIEGNIIRKNKEMNLEIHLKGNSRIEGELPEGIEPITEDAPTPAVPEVL